MDLGFSSLRWLTLRPPALLCFALFSYLYNHPMAETREAQAQPESEGPQSFFPLWEHTTIQETGRIKQELAKLHLLYSTGNIQVLNVTDPDMVKELANCKT
ncbi:hypothetical protein EJB05_29804, partial [Eragrostis curvula]